MTICPIAIVVGCRKCPAFSVCPLKTVVGDADKKPDIDSATEPLGESGKRPGSGSRQKK